MKLSIRNFKMIKSLDIVLDGDCIIKGSHDSGKTTIADAITWAFLNTNIYNSPNFEPKPIDKNGNIIDAITSVTIQIGNKEFKKETSFKKDVEGRIIGNDIKYYLNSVLVRKSDYDSDISKMFGMSGDLLLVAMNPKVFAESLTIPKRRKILLDMTGSVSRDSLIDMWDGKDSHKEYIRSLDGGDIYKMSSSLTSMINKAKSTLKTNNDLISELRTDVLDKDFSDVELKIRDIDKEIAKIQSDIENRRSSVDNSDVEKAQKIKDELIHKVREADIELRSKKSELKTPLDSTIAMSKAEVNRLKGELIELREKIGEIGSREMSIDNCGECGQAYPDDKIESIKESFERKKREEFNLVKERGIKLKDIINERELSIKKLEEEDNLIHSHNKKINKEIKKLEDRLMKATLDRDEFIIPDVVKFDAREYQEKILKLEESKAKYREELDKKVVSDFAKKKIEDAEQSILATQNELLELLDNKLACDKFNKFEISFIEESVNSMFKTVKFAMFEETFSGEPKQICDPRINGVPYSQLNGRGKVVVSKEISEAIISYYGNSVMTMVDQRESAYDVTINTGNSLMLQAVEEFEPNIRLEKINGGSVELELFVNK